MSYKNFASFIWKSHQFVVQKIIYVHKVINKRFSDDYDHDNIAYGILCSQWFCDKVWKVYIGCLEKIGKNMWTAVKLDIWLVPDFQSTFFAGLGSIPIKLDPSVWYKNPITVYKVSHWSINSFNQLITSKNPKNYILDINTLYSHPTNQLTNTHECIEF